MSDHTSVSIEQEKRARFYKFCPVCSSKLEIIKSTDEDRPTCNSCGFVQYLNPAPAAGAVVFNGGRLLMVKRAHPPYVGKWTLPAGFMEWGESPEETAVRELKEETNLDVKLRELFHVYSGSDDPRTRAIMVLYFADIEGGKLRPDDDALEAKFFALEELPTDEQIAFESHRRAVKKLREEFPERFEE